MYQTHIICPSDPWTLEALLRSNAIMFTVEGIVFLISGLIVFAIYKIMRHFKGDQPLPLKPFFLATAVPALVAIVWALNNIFHAYHLPEPDPTCARPRLAHGWHSLLSSIEAIGWYLVWCSVTYKIYRSKTSPEKLK